jgi:hypothetical protein
MAGVMGDEDYFTKERGGLIDSALALSRRRLW